MTGCSGGESTGSTVSSPNMAAACRATRLIRRRCNFPPRSAPRTIAAWLATLGRADGAVSIYIHVPFCAKLCWYCGCHTKVANSHAPISDYVGDLLGEIDLVAAALSERLAIGSVHFGGGTPNMLSPDELSRILARLSEKFDLRADADIAVEIDPRLLSREWAIDGGAERRQAREPRRAGFLSRGAGGDQSRSTL